jgi:hypothetical protein
MRPVSWIPVFWSTVSWSRIAATLLAATTAICAGCASTEPPPEVALPASVAQDTRSAESANSDRGPVVDPEATAILERAGALLRDLEAYTFHAQLSWSDVIFDGVKVRFGGTLDAAVRRPSSLHVEYVTDRDDKSVWYDGEGVTVLSADHDVFSKLAVSGSIDDALAFVRERHGVSLPLTNLLLSDPVADMDERLEFGYLLGTAWIDGVPCHHLLFLESGLHWQVWIDARERPVPRQVAITYIDVPGQPEFLATLSDWDFDAEFDPQRFTPKVPETATQIDWIGPEVRDAK